MGKTSKKFLQLTNPIKLILLVITGLVIINAVIVYIFSISDGSSIKFLSQKGIDRNNNQAESIIRSCSENNTEFCYASIFHDITKDNSIGYAIALLSEVQRLDPTTRGCHFIAHSISTAETEKDLSQWEDVLKKIPVGACSGGYVHGVIEARQQNDPSFVISSTTIPKICDIVRKSTDSKGTDDNCSHIMGHLAMVETEGNIDQAVAICNDIPEHMQYECFSGVYMENETRDNLVAHDIAERIPWNEDTTREQSRLCLKASGLAAKACWREVSHMFAFITRSDPAPVFALCSQPPTDEMKLECYRHAVGIMTVNSDFRKDKWDDLCRPFEANPQSFRMCYVNAIGSMMMSSHRFADRAIDLCKSIPAAFAEDCYAVLGNRLIAAGTSADERKAYCASAPQMFQPRCLDGY